MINKIENPFGGENIYQNGVLMGSTSPNILGGVNVFTDTGELVGHTSDNILGGVNMYDKTGSYQGFTSENILGGEQIYDGTGSLSGYTAEFGDMTTLFNSNGGLETIVSNCGIEAFGDVDLDPDSIVESISTIADFI